MSFSNQQSLFPDVKVIEPLSERDRDAGRKRQARAETRDIQIPAVVDPSRRERCRDPLLYLPTYHPEQFYLPMSHNHREIVAETVRVMVYGGCQALAEPRGFGKTTTLEFLTLWAVFYGMLDLIGYCAASQPEAVDRLNELKLELQSNDLLLADFPEFVAPIRALEGNAQRAHGQTVNGELTMIAWTRDRIVMPTISGTAAQGQCVATRGIESSLRGLKHQGRRPKFWMLDDVQKRETAMSPLQISSVLDTIERDIGMGGDNRRKIASVALMTIIAEGDAADQLTSPEKYPAWNGKCRSLLTTPPTREDLWEKYIEMYRTSQSEGDRFARNAHTFYLSHRDEMDAGATVAWDLLYFGRHMNYANLLTMPGDEEQTEESTDEWDAAADRDATIRALSQSSIREFFADRFTNLDPEIADSLSLLNVLPDGTEIEASALQHCYNIIAEKGLSVFRSECQNEPVDLEDTADRLTVDMVAGRINQLPRNTIPSTCDHLTMFIDVHKSPLYYILIAWESNGTGYIINYGTYPRQRNKTLMEATRASSLEGAIHQGLVLLTEDDGSGEYGFLSRTFLRDDGAEMRVERCLIDAGWGPQTDTVYRFCRTTPFSGVVYPSMGEYIRATGTPLTKSKKKRGERMGHNWRQGPSPTERRIRLVQYDTNYWKSFSHERFRTAAGERGSMTLFGKSEKIHRVFAEHITSERATKVHSAARGTVEEWRQIPNRENHLLDALAGACVAGSMVGVKFQPHEVGRVTNSEPSSGGQQTRPLARKKRSASTRRSASEAVANARKRRGH